MRRHGTERPTLETQVSIAVNSIRELADMDLDFRPHDDGRGFDALHRRAFVLSVQCERTTDGVRARVHAHGGYEEDARDLIEWLPSAWGIEVE